jgi:CheY-like chemotaxis protein
VSARGREARQRQQEPGPRRKTAKIILCIDDNEQALSVRKFLLETRGYRVLSALTAEEAMEFFERGGIDLVICDLVMPHTDGNELVKRMKERSPEVPAMLVSGAVHNFDRATAADAFLPKGQCSPSEILERVRMMVARKRGPRKQIPRPEPQSQPAQPAARQVAAS